MKNPRLAAIFITAMALGGLATLTTGTLKMTALHPYQFLCLLLLGALTSRTKVKLNESGALLSGGVEPTRGSPRTLLVTSIAFGN